MPPADLDLDKTVLMAAMNADENGYSHWESPFALADDMANCDAELEVYEPQVIEEAIIRLGILQKEVVGYVIQIPAS